MNGSATSNGERAVNGLEERVVLTEAIPATLAESSDALSDMTSETIHRNRLERMLITTAIELSTPFQTIMSFNADGWRKMEINVGKELTIEKSFKVAVEEIFLSSCIRALIHHRRIFQNERRESTLITDSKTMDLILSVANDVAAHFMAILFRATHPREPRNFREIVWDELNTGIADVFVYYRDRLKRSLKREMARRGDECADAMRDEAM